MITDAVLITIYAVLAALVVTTAVSFAWHRMHQKLSNAYYWITACLMGWLITTIIYHINPNPQYMEYIDNLAFPFIAFLPVAMLVFVLYFYRSRNHFKKWVVALLCIMPTITSVISVVPALNGLLRSNYTILQIYPLHISNYTWNVWYYIHAVYSYIIMIFCGVATILQYKKQPREYRLPSIILLIGLGISYLGDLPSFGLPDAVLDNTLVGVCISMVILYIATLNNPSVEFLSAARKALYNNIEMPVFILDRQDYVLEMNRAAYNMVEALGIEYNAVPPLAFGDISSVIHNLGGQVTSGFEGDDAPHILLCLNGKNVVLNQVRRDLADKKGRPLGSYIAMLDITQMSQKIRRLQSLAEIDALTGIPNRMAFEKRATELDRPENLPLSFIMGDVNRLKQINDSMGHRQGDRLLQAVAQILADACPEEGFAARIGGDEFILVIPHCNSERAQIVVSSISIALKDCKAQFGDASIALGFVTKTRPEQNTAQLIHEADQLMYSQKKYDRRKRTESPKR